MKALKLERVESGWSVRLRCGKGQNPRFIIRLAREADAQARAVKMAELSRLLVRAGRTTEAPVILRKAGEQTTPAGFAEVARFCRDLCGTKAPAATPPRPRVPTVREFGEQWVSGELHRLYPDQIPLKRTAADDACRLAAHIYPTIGSKRIDEVKLDDCERIMRSIPASAARSRRHIAGTIARIFRMSVYPLRFIERSPIPPGFSPKTAARRAYAYLYPDEDRRLLACSAIPLTFRLLWGFLVREGMRESEALSLTWECVDLKRGAVRLDKNKTDDPRSWALDAGVAQALRVYREWFRPDAGMAGLVFVSPNGDPISKYGLAELLRAHLETIGLKQERPELFVTNAERHRMRVHDLRGTFVTLSLAAGRSESWIADRTGHRSSAMIARYKRTARSFAELNLGSPAPLIEVIPELLQLLNQSTGTEPASTGCAAGCAGERDSSMNTSVPNGIRIGTSGSTDARGGVNPARPSAGGDTSERSGAPPAQGAGGSESGRDPIELALAEGIRSATAAGQWAVVSQLAGELEARRLVRSAPEVVSLAAARAKRTGGGQ